MPPVFQNIMYREIHQPHVKRFSVLNQSFSQMMNRRKPFVIIFICKIRIAEQRVWLPDRLVLFIEFAFRHPQKKSRIDLGDFFREKLLQKTESFRSPLQSASCVPVKSAVFRGFRLVKQTSSPQSFPV